MVVDDLFGVVHAAVTDFDGVAVKYFAEAVVLIIYIYVCIWSLLVDFHVEQCTIR